MPPAAVRSARAQEACSRCSQVHTKALNLLLVGSRPSVRHLSLLSWLSALRFSSKVLQVWPAPNSSVQTLRTFTFCISS